MGTADVTPPERAVLRRRRRRPTEQGALLFIGAAAVVCILVTVGIVVTLAQETIPFFGREGVGLGEFFGSWTWQPVTGEFGVLPLLYASILIALIAAGVAIPLGLGAAIYLSEYAREGVRRTVKPILELLAGMPTIVLGFFALETLTPTMMDVGILERHQVYNALSAGVVVGILISPLISSLSEDALRAVPRSMREGAFGLGASRRVVALRVVFPAALSGVMASIVLALSRAVGETMAVTLAAGTIPTDDGNPRDAMQTITAYIVAVSKGETARGTVQYESIFAVGALLFVVTLIINLVAVRLVRKYRTVYQ